MLKRVSVNIHFVCTGNIYRSRLAEAYLCSLRLPSIEISSSGTQASTQNKGSIAWYTLRLLYRNNLLSYMSSHWRETTQAMLDRADLVIYFGKSNYQFCCRKFNFSQKHEVWDIADFDDRSLNGQPLNSKKEIEYIEISEGAFSKIKAKVNNLVNLHHQFHQSEM